MRWLARSLLGAFGWRLVGEPPDAPRCVVIFAPHTSNWDFPLLLLLRGAAGRRVSYLAKHTLFRFPFGWFFRASGALPVERSEHHDLVDKLARSFRELPELWLAMSPEGTRARTDHWKSGFYYIALEARVPVLLAFIDARRRECGLGALIELTGDVTHDLARIAAFYADKQGIVPERASEIRFLGADLED
jgi:1-acyl-sn-glycerol-3-phosphate acyltransferase